MWLLPLVRDTVSGYFYPSKPTSTEDEETKAAQAQQRFKRSLELRVIDYVDNLECSYCHKEFEEGRVVSYCLVACAHCCSWFAITLRIVRLVSLIYCVRSCCTVY